MKKLFKIVGRVILGILLLIFLVALGSYNYITTKWKRHFTEDEILVRVKEINSAPQLSTTFYGIYDKLHDNDRHKSMTRIYATKVWQDIVMNRHFSQTSSCVRAANHIPQNYSKIEHSDFIFAWGLEKYTTPEKCFDFAMCFENMGLRRHDSTFKDITLLTDTNEVLEYLLKSNSPTLYRHNPDLLKERTERLRNRLNE